MQKDQGGHHIFQTSFVVCRVFWLDTGLCANAQGSIWLTCKDHYSQQVSLSLPFSLSFNTWWKWLCQSSPGIVCARSVCCQWWGVSWAKHDIYLTTTSPSQGSSIQSQFFLRPQVTREGKPWSLLPSCWCPETDLKKCTHKFFFFICITCTYDSQ